MTNCIHPRFIEVLPAPPGARRPRRGRGLGLVAVLLGSLVAGAGAQSLPGTQDRAERLDLKVLYLGSSAESEHSRRDAAERGQRFEAFRTYLEATFRASKVMDRDQFQPRQAEGFDVVLLDWSQQDVDFTEMASLESPLGPREDWTVPTVLLGSAGLLIAGPWQLPGSWG